MKLLHTADWHAGRTLHGVDRTPEIREVLREIADIALSEAVDLIIVAGDVFDSKNPGADATSAVYEFFLKTGAAGVPSVVIAGNHDSPSRLDASSDLLKLTNVHLVGHPKVAGQGGVFDLEIGNETARVAALPLCLGAAHRQGGGAAGHRPWTVVGKVPGGGCVGSFRTCLLSSRATW